MSEDIIIESDLSMTMCGMSPIELIGSFNHNTNQLSLKEGKGLVWATLTMKRKALLINNIVHYVTSISIDKKTGEYEVEILSALGGFTAKSPEVCPICAPEDEE